jgi:hypothetical protein
MGNGATGGGYWRPRWVWSFVCAPRRQDAGAGPWRLLSSSVRRTAKGRTGVTRPSSNTGATGRLSRSPLPSRLCLPSQALAKKHLDTTWLGPSSWPDTPERPSLLRGWAFCSSRCRGALPRFFHRLVLAWSLRMYTVRPTDDLRAKERYLVLKDPFTSAALLASGRSLERSEHTRDASRPTHGCVGGSHRTSTREHTGALVSFLWCR